MHAFRCEFRGDLQCYVPEWLVTILLGIFLTCCTFATCKVGVCRWNRESGALLLLENEDGCVLDDVAPVNGEGPQTPLLAEEREVGRVLPLKKLEVLVTVWVSFLLLHVWQGDRHGQGLIPIVPCGVAYWFISALQIPLALVFTLWFLLQNERPKHLHVNPQDDVMVLEGRQSPNLAFPIVAFSSGVLGGLFGIGGGMIINPALLQIGISLQVTAATCSFMVLFSSSMLAVLYLLLGLQPLDHALCFAAMCFFSSLLGLLLVQSAIQKYGRVSLIIFSVGTGMAISTLNHHLVLFALFPQSGPS
ncbi:hypothetical protein AMTRI_Chr02g217710 [Amborella trichopoda]